MHVQDWSMFVRQFFGYTSLYFFSLNRIEITRCHMSTMKPIHGGRNTRRKKEIILRLNYILCWFCSISRFFFSPTSFSDFIIRLINVIIERLKYHLGLWATHESSIFAYSPRIWKTHNKNMNLNYLQTTLLM